MIELGDLPTVNATLNAVAFVLLLCGRRLIGQKRITAHKRCMVAAFVVSILFLISYLTNRFFGAEKRFGGTGWIRPIYFLILISHVLLAAAVPFLASWTLYLAWRGRFERHRRWARFTFPIWVYVSVTGVLVYVLLFKLYGPATQPVGTLRGV